MVVNGGTSAILAQVSALPGALLKTAVGLNPPRVRISRPPLEISTRTLAAGDLLLTGTPGGVAAFREAPLWLSAGDVVEVDISRVGVLRNVVAAE